MTKYYAIDPGKVTGVVTCTVWPSAQDPYWPAPTIDLMDEIHVDGIHDWLAQYLDVGGIPYPDPRIVICENFTLHSASTNSSQPDALHIIGALKYLSNKHGFKLVMQPPSNKKFADNSKLKYINWYEASKGQHKNDAVRHLIYYLMFHEMNPWLIERMNEMIDPIGGGTFSPQGLVPIIGKHNPPYKIIEDPSMPKNTAYYIDPQAMWYQDQFHTNPCAPKWGGWQSYTEPTYEPPPLTFAELDAAMKAAMPSMKAALNEPNILFQQLTANVKGGTAAKKSRKK
jgi:hypothetical protein